MKSKPYLPSLWLLVIILFAQKAIITHSQDTDSNVDGSNSSDANKSKSRTATITPADELLTTQLRGGTTIPLLGTGIGNLPHETIPRVLHATLRPELDIRLIDTAHASRNERILGEAISKFGLEGRRLTSGGGGDHDDEELPPIHVVTKVWYTHLGYERTKLSVRESLTELQSAFASVDNGSANPNNQMRKVYVHMLLHWPRCNDEIPWMNCQEEEDNLPSSVRDLGPPPHLDKENAWQESWRALEELYEQYSAKRAGRESQRQPIIASIGVSNFELEDMTTLMQIAKVPPHIYQGNAWLVFHDPHLMNFLRENNIFFQAYGVMNGILQRRDDSPAAFHMLSTIADELREAVKLSLYEKKGKEASRYSPVITEATVLLGYFLHSKVGVIPRASSSAHQHENSPSSLVAILPHLTDAHMQQLKVAIPALMKGEVIHASISFMNNLPGPIQIHWIHPDTEEEVLVSTMVHAGAVEVLNTHPGHRFVAYDTEREVRREFLVEVGYGQRQHFHVEL